MPYFQLRITFSELRTIDICLLSIRRLIRHYNLKEHSCGIEQLNKYGEPCDPHIHFNFVADIERVNPKRCIQDWLRRWFANKDVELKGNKMWSLQMVEEPQDYDRWLRYPLKEENEHVGKTVVLFKKEDLSGVELLDHYHNLRIRAKDERKTSIEMNILRREKLRVKDQFKQKLYAWIEDPELAGKFPECANVSIREGIWIYIFKYYQKIEKPINFSTITGYCNLYMADKGWLKARDAYKLANNNQGN